MEVESSGGGGNGDFTLTVARPVLQPHQGGRGECGKASCEMEVAMVWWIGR